ncbi:MAG TPA: GDP-mannose 4,6-dehydratase [Solirubrobacteraceae bacterium]|jgi:CDP-glucose 4,6-dehydratase
MAIDSDFWSGRRVLLTGHTGFKGAWLSLWLQSLGARVTGLAPSVAPTSPSLYELAGVAAGMAERVVDVRDRQAVLDAFAAEHPEVVLHLAAQPLVRRSLVDPAGTYEVNVMGTVNVLDAVRLVGQQVRAVVVVTSDKCYENPGHGSVARKDSGHEDLGRENSDPDNPAPHKPFVEDDPLGGSDPYSSSKGCAELVTMAYRRSFFADPDGPRVASARAGNVIGGGDWGEDRLIPDIVRAVTAGEPIAVRNPQAVRPWQHVLNPLGGYLLLAQRLWNSPEAARGWNFGPAPGDVRTVRAIVEFLRERWGEAFAWELDGAVSAPEAAHLALDSSAAIERLGWQPAWDLEQALDRVVQWYQAHLRGEDMRRVTFDQIAEFS